MDPTLTIFSINPYPQIHTNNWTHRQSLAPCCWPHYCQAGLALLHTAGGDREPLKHSPSSCHSSGHLNLGLISDLPQLCLVHSVTPVHPITSSASYDMPLSSQNPLSSSSSIQPTIQSTAHISPPSPGHANYSCSGQVNGTCPDPFHGHIEPRSPMSPASTQNMSSLLSKDLRSPLSSSSLGLPLFPMAAQSCTIRDRDLSQLNHCLHHIISRRTSSPVLIYRTARQPISSQGNVIIYNLPVNDIQSLGSSPTTQHKAPDAPLSVVGSKVRHYFMVCQ